jgi:hypothetical protein
MMSLERNGCEVIRHASSDADSLLYSIVLES